MNDWRKTQYRLTPKPDPLAEAEDFKFGVGGWLLVLGTLGALVLALIGLFGIL